MATGHTERSTSLSYELHDLQHALAALVHLTGAAEEAPELLDARRIMWAASAVATLARERVSLLRQILNSDADPGLLHHEGNAGPSGADGDVDLPTDSSSKPRRTRRR